MTEIVGTAHQVVSHSAHDGSKLHVHLWEKRRGDAAARNGAAILLVHGSRRSGHVAFDLPVPLAAGEFSYSFMDVLAGAGYDVFSLDLQCYGRSDHHPSGLAVTSEVAAADIGAAVEYICRELGVAAVLLIGWSWGATTTALYAESNPARVRKLVLYGGRMVRLNVADGGPLAVSLDDQFCRNTREVSTLTLQPDLTEPKVLEAWLAEGESWDAESPNGVAADFQTRMPLSDPAKLTMPKARPLAMEKVRGMVTTVRKAGMATAGLFQSILPRPDIIIAPTRIRAGVAAAVGMAWTKGARKRVSRKRTPTVTAVRPVRPPAATPAALSI